MAWRNPHSCGGSSDILEPSEIEEAVLRGAHLKILKDFAFSG
jgi:hypothetical protein